MKKWILLIALCVAGVASAQPTPVSPAEKGAAQGTGPSGTSTAGTGSAASPAPPPGGRQWYEELADHPIQEEGSFWLPKGVNQAADESDTMFYSVLALSVFFFVAIAVVIVYFVVKYRHRPGRKPEPSSAHNDALEITWTVIPTIIVVFLFYYGWNTYVRVVTPPTKAVEINVLAWRWNWYSPYLSSSRAFMANTPPMNT